MKDSFGREIDYLRISVTDLCNFRCVYCMPKKGITKLNHNEIISVDRIEEIVKAYVELGIKKIRLTGGEPLVRKGIIEICKRIKSVNGVEELCLTTNGYYLPELAKELKEVGVNRLNISLDTLNKNKFKRITRNGDLDIVLSGINEAQNVGFNDIKINCVLIKGFNDTEINDFISFAIENNVTIRFIELMPIGEATKMEESGFVSNKELLSSLPNLKKVKDDGAASYYQVGDNGPLIGLISPLSNKFCESCSRMRLTADGKLKPCLHSKQEFDTNGLHGKELEEVLKEAILAKPKEHHLLENNGSSSLRGMNKIGG